MRTPRRDAPDRLGSKPVRSGVEKTNALVAQLDRASDFDSEGREFESLRARHLQFYASVRCGNIRVALGALLLASAARFRHSTRRSIGPYATVPSRCDAS